MAITWADVQAIAPGDSAITGLSVPAGLIFVTMAYAEMNATIWGANLDIGARYLAAHKFTIGNRPGGYGGPTSNEKVGDVSRGSAVKIDDVGFESTPYGREYKRLLRNLQIESRWLVTGGPNLIPPPSFGGPPFIP